MRRWHPSKHTGKLLKREVAAATKFRVGLIGRGVSIVVPDRGWIVYDILKGLSGKRSRISPTRRHVRESTYRTTKYLLDTPWLLVIRIDASDHPRRQRPGVPTV